VRQRFRTVAEAYRDRAWQTLLKQHPEGVIGIHHDGTNITVSQHEWHIDHAPTVEEVLKRRTGRSRRVTDETDEVKSLNP
jgi:hypothetical protein